MVPEAPALPIIALIIIIIIIIIIIKKLFVKRSIQQFSCFEAPSCPEITKLTLDPKMVFEEAVLK